MSYSVYKHTSPNGKVYIGITSNDPKRRWGNGSHYSNNSYFSNAIKKYGWDNFTHEIIQSDLDADAAEEIERKLISEYDSTNREHGYNLTNGGEKGKKHSPESIEKMRLLKLGKYDGEKNPRYGVHLSEETKLRISEGRKGKCVGSDNPNFGKPMSEEQKMLISKTRSGNHYPKLSESMKTSELCIAVHEKQKKQVVQLSKDGKPIKIWKSAADASDYLLGKRTGQSNICSCANGKINTAYGYKWKHYNEPMK